MGGGFVKKFAKTATDVATGKPIRDVTMKGVGEIGEALTPDINIPEMETTAEDVVDPQAAVTEAAKKKRARVKAQQEQSTLLTGATATGGNKSLLG